MDRSRASTSGGELAYVEQGEGPVVVLLHGFPQSSYVWRQVVPMLSSRFRVIAPDLLGSGDSDKPVDVPLGLAAQARYVRELLDALGVDRFAVVAHSVGAGVAQLLALDHVGVDALVLIDATAFDRWPTAPTRSAQQAQPDRETEEMIRVGMRAALFSGMLKPDRLTEEDVREYTRPWTGPGGVAAFFRLIRSLDGRGLEDRDDDLRALEIPVLIFWGENDPYYPVDIAERLNETIPTSTLALVPGCGHFLVDEAPETIVPMIYEYLRARYLRAPHGHADPSGIVSIQLERRPPWVDPQEPEGDDRSDHDDQETT
jgi:pimeloyl-ACP methyl ester carboxylesterase